MVQEILCQILSNMEKMPFVSMEQLPNACFNCLRRHRSTFHNYSGHRSKHLCKNTLGGHCSVHTNTYDAGAPNMIRFSLSSKAMHSFCNLFITHVQRLSLCRQRRSQELIHEASLGPFTGGEQCARPPLRGGHQRSWSDDPRSSPGLAAWRRVGLDGRSHREAFRWPP